MFDAVICPLPLCKNQYLPLSNTCAAPVQSLQQQVNKSAFSAPKKLQSQATHGSVVLSGQVTSKYYNKKW